MVKQPSWAARVVGVVVALVAFGAAKYLVRSHPLGLALVPQPPSMPAEFHAEFPAEFPTATADRVRAAMDEEMAPLLTHPELRRRAIAISRSATSAAEGHAAAQTMGQELSRRGFRRLPFDELREWNRLRQALASGSEAACAGFWSGGLEPAVVYNALAQLSDADLRSWMRISSHAGVLELEALHPVAADEEALADGVDSILASLGETDRAAFESAIDAGEHLVEPTAACNAFRWMVSIDALPHELQERYLRGLAAAASPVAR